MTRPALPTIRQPAAFKAVMEWLHDQWDDDADKIGVTDGAGDVVLKDAAGVRETLDVHSKADADAAYQRRHAVDVAAEYGTTQEDVEAAIAANQDGALLFKKGTTFTGTGGGQRATFGGVREVHAAGAVFDNFHVRLDGDDIHWYGGRVDQGDGTSNNSMFLIEGRGVRVFGVEVDGPESFTGIEVRNAFGSRPQDIWLFACDSRAKSGMTIWSSKSVHLVGCYANGSYNNDDSFVIKDADDHPGEGTEDITLTDCWAYGSGSLLAIGTHAKHVRNVTVHGGGAKDGAAHLVYIKPGQLAAVGSSATENGVVENITVKGAVMYDPTGAGMQAPVTIHAGKAAKVKNIDIDVQVIGRQFTDITTRAFIHIYAAEVNEMAGTEISNVTLRGKFYDPEGGAANAEGVPGHPARDGISLDADENQTVRDVYCRGVEIDGSGGSYAAMRGDGAFEGDFIFDVPVMKNIRGDAGGRYAFDSFQRGTILHPVFDDSVIGTFPTYRLISVDSGSAVELHVSVADGNPNSGLACGRGSTCRRRDGGAGTSFYVKEADDDADTGWAAK